MDKKLLLWLTAAAGYIGLGMVFGHTLGNSTSNNELWVGGILIFFSAVLLGMYISSRSVKHQVAPKPEADKK